MPSADSQYVALVIPADAEAPPVRVVVNRSQSLATLQELVGGNIEALPLPYDRGDVTAYVNDEGKYTCLDDDGEVIVNRRATRFMKPGIGLFVGDFIAGDFVICGFDPSTGENVDLPDDFEVAV